ncbi:unnamed protein product, partial [Ectocarpus fasciculatus]
QPALWICSACWPGCSRVDTGSSHWADMHAQQRSCRQPHHGRRGVPGRLRRGHLPTQEKSAVQVLPCQQNGKLPGVLQRWRHAGGGGEGTSTVGH